MTTALPTALLTPRQVEVVRLLLRGYSGTQIARELVLTHNTVKLHVAHIYDRLGLYDANGNTQRLQLFAWAEQAGVLEVRL